MTFQEFQRQLGDKAIYETIYDDTEGRRIVVIKLLELYSLFNKLLKDKND